MSTILEGKTMNTEDTNALNKVVSQLLARVKQTPNPYEQMRATKFSEWKNRNIDIKKYACGAYLNHGLSLAKCGEDGILCPDCMTKYTKEKLR